MLFIFHHLFDRICAGGGDYSDFTDGLLQLFQRVFFDAGDIAAADAVESCHLLLGVGDMAVETVAAADDISLPWIQTVLHGAAYLKAVFLILQVGKEGVVSTHHVQEIQCVAASVGFDGVGEGDFALKFALRAEVHQYFVFDAATGIGGKADVFVAAEGVDGFDKADGADGDEIILIVGLGVILLGGLMPVKTF